MKEIIVRYRNLVRQRLSLPLNDDERDLRYWQSQLFGSFLVYCLPVSLIALIPGVCMALKDGFPVIAAVDMICFVLISLATFSARLSLRNRKILVLLVFYFLAIFLIDELGYVGPGVFYLFFITVLTALIFPIRYAYWSIWFNAAILSVFALIIGFDLFHSALALEYTAGKWIAFSVNLVFASLIIVLLIDKIFEGLQLTIVNKSKLRERYRLIFDKSPLPMWLFDTDNYRFLEVNEAALRHYGYRKEEFLGMSIMDIRCPENVAETIGLVGANKLSGEFYRGNAQHVKKDGEKINVRVESNLLSLDDRPVRLVLATDITAQVRHEAEVLQFTAKIRESESNLRALFDSAVDGFVLLDAEKRIKLFNPKASASIRFNRDQAAFEIGRSIFDFVETSRLAYFTELIGKVYQGETVDYDRLYRTNGTLNWIRYTLTPVREELAIVGACITGRDVTARKLYLRSVEEQNKVFREISWMQSHLVRAPLARIMGLLPMLRTETRPDEREQILDFLQLSATELDQIVKKITRKSARITSKYPQLSEVD